MNLSLARHLQDKGQWRGIHPSSETSFLEIHRVSIDVGDVRFPTLPAWWPRFLAVAILVLPVTAFFVMINRNVALAPLVGMDMQCAECNRKATRTLQSAADALRVKGIYVYDRKKYPKAAPAWCDRHRPDGASDNALTAYMTAIGIFVAGAAVYKQTAT